MRDATETLCQAACGTSLLRWQVFQNELGMYALQYRQTFSWGRGLLNALFSGRQKGQRQSDWQWLRSDDGAVQQYASLAAVEQAMLTEEAAQARAQKATRWHLVGGKDAGQSPRLYIRDVQREDGERCAGGL